MKRRSFLKAMLAAPLAAVGVAWGVGDVVEFTPETLIKNDDFVELAIQWTKGTRWEGHDPAKGQVITYTYSPSHNGYNIESVRVNGVYQHPSAYEIVIDAHGSSFIEFKYDHA